MILVGAEKIARYTDAGWWGNTTFGDRFLAWVDEQPDVEAVVDAPNRAAITDGPVQRWTYADLAHEVGRWAAFLIGQGLRKDDVVVVQCPNIVELHALYLACAMTGVIVSPIPVQYRAHEIEHVVERTGARMSFTVARVGKHELAASWQALLGSLPTLEAVWALGDATPSGIGPLSTALRDTLPLSPDALRAYAKQIGLTANDVVTVCWTSGTEARPKGVPRSHNQWLTVGRGTAEAASLPSGARMLVPFPFTNMAGYASCMAAWLHSGGCLVHHHPFDSEVFLTQLVDEGAEYAVAPPAVLTLLLKEPERLAQADLSRLRRIGCGGAPLSAWLIDAFEQRFGIRIVNLYSSNEGGSLASTPEDVPDSRTRAQFFPRLGVAGFDWSLPVAKRMRTRLVDMDTGEDIAQAGQPGELRFEGPNVFDGYWRDPAATERAFDAQGYYRSGDLFEIAGPRGEFYRYVGRHKDIVIRGGMNISCEEIEALLLEHPQVRDAAVIGLADPVMGERLCAVVVPQPGEALTLPRLCEFLRVDKQIAVFKLPEQLQMLESLPRNPVGKVLKRDLRAMFQTPQP
ncbi:class I adenylate-forming enzyme family protein [Hydrogenophaga sp.]|uniref:class I adenylate-forming enzyme family protein n=1 Tax=Hydrogenophaga sp. TaxID=1904254 RepID=UPI0027205EF1|nr:class I adenylate-forming enzyme family protein [Hydrogenophaga sp.]MDO9438543.1 class I adenylate-forming enzyme family protein [Hydrogenophaga sp.]